MYYIIGLFKDKIALKLLFFEKVHFCYFLVEKSVNHNFIIFNFDNFYNFENLNLIYNINGGLHNNYTTVV